LAIDIGKFFDEGMLASHETAPVIDRTEGRTVLGIWRLGPESKRSPTC